MHVKIAQITDLHLLPIGELLMGLDVNARLDKVLAHLMKREPDAIFLTGDFCAAEPKQEIFHMLRARLDPLGVPYYLTPGNHDDRVMLRNAFFLGGHNQDPIRGLVRVKDQDFLFLDSSMGKVDSNQIEWLGRALQNSPDASVVLHHPPVPMGVTFMDNTYPLKQTNDLIKLLTTDRRPRKVFCGHFHSGRTVRWKNLEVHLCPPTSFFINPDNTAFQQEMLPPAYLMLEWMEDGSFRSTPSYVV
ncbi:metallophosphoesterase [Neolewinella aurantiaca]|uniref:metallophosphoesterase n=1 Tax=Neolewinella aurantiaca TaxID=2602767 RepID=UPI00164F03FF|nr:metallophosphoesterase [Neolewinella aurantiaca]